MIDIQAYPHILQAVAGSSDRPTLCALSRVSSSIKELVLPLLYPTILADPFADLSSIDSRHGADTIPIRLSAERVKHKLESLLSSPHLALSQQINITHPEIWAGHIRRLQKVPDPAVRAGGTTTVIWVKPFVPGQDKSMRVDSEGNVIVKKERKKKGKQAPGRDSKAGSSAELVPDGWGTAVQSNGSEGDEFKHIFDIATLLPSTYLVLKIPPSSGVNVQAFFDAACIRYCPPDISRKLTIICGSGNRLHTGGTSVLHGRSWEAMEVILSPNSAGIFDFELDHFSLDATMFIPFKTLMSIRGGVRFLLAMPIMCLQPSAKYTVVGVDALKLREITMEDLMEDVRRTCGQVGRAGSVSFVKLCEWRKTADIGVSCLAW